MIKWENIYYVRGKLLYDYKGKYNNIYNTRQELVEVDNYNSNDLLTTKTFYKYDNHGNKIEEYSPDFWQHGVGFIDKYKSKSNGNIVVRKNIIIPESYNDSIIKKIASRYPAKQKLFYNDNGDLIQRNEYDNMTKKVFKECLSYNNQNNIIECKDYNDGKMVSITTYQYDTNNNPILLVTRNPDGTITQSRTYSYTYDTTGNYIEKQCYVNSIFTNVIKREIEYY